MFYLSIICALVFIVSLFSSVDSSDHAFRDLLIVVAFVSSILMTITLSFSIERSSYNSGYKQGQIDALSGKEKYFAEPEIDTVWVSKNKLNK